MRVVLFRGRPGVGKATLSTIFSSKNNLPLISKDSIYEIIFDYVHDHDVRSKICYNVLYSILESNLDKNQIFVLDFPFQNEKDFSIIKQWCVERKVPLRSILVTCSDESLWERRFSIRAPNHRPSSFLKNFQFLKEYYKTLEVHPEPGEIILDSVNPIEYLLDQIANEHILE